MKKKTFIVLLYFLLAVGALFILSGCVDNEPMSTQTPKFADDLSEEPYPENGYELVSRFENPNDKAEIPGIDILRTYEMYALTADNDYVYSPLMQSYEPTLEQNTESDEITSSVADAKAIINGFFSHLKITYVSDMDIEIKGIHHYGFIVYFPDSFISDSYTHAYAWVSSIEDADVRRLRFEEAGYTEAGGRNWYANIPDSRFPIPMRDGEIIFYDRFSPPDYVSGIGYGFYDTSVMEIYQEQLRNAGFTDHGRLTTVYSFWTYEIIDGTVRTVLAVEMQLGVLFSMHMYVNVHQRF